MSRAVGVVLVVECRYAWRIAQATKKKRLNCLQLIDPTATINPTSSDGAEQKSQVAPTLSDDGGETKGS